MRRASPDTSAAVYQGDGADIVALSLTDHETGQSITKHYHQKEFLWLISRMLAIYFRAWGRDDG